MAVLLEKKEQYLSENQQDLANYSGGDLAMEKRLLMTLKLTE
jgi:hypothetical protein